MANGLDEKRAVAFAKQVRDLNRSGLPLRIFSGLECDIRRDGAMDLAEDALAELDIVVGSVHSHMNLEAAEMTDRLMRALESPSLRVMGHPTGRILLNRDPFPFDFERVAAGSRAPQRVSGNQRQPRAARPGRRHGPHRERHWAQSSPSPPTRIRPSISASTCLSASSWRAAGWLEPRDVLNTLPLAEFEKAIHKS